ncbi:hypothetical protein PPYR_13222 [Photinus pyralis]|uniref:CCAAT-binding factor domain-containing protein n=1 Tax=Photinus pyralis TaxID=7054 RepID=A0A1Y1L8R3_PHOPY|nr:nucleolar complex protein 4 homolog A [Photinus pyralis]KAB0793602.1 hypothetical protein PPYR_13222 [Photinus pyralis]
MSNVERTTKISKVLRLKAQEFLSSYKYADNLVDIIRHFETGADLLACLLSLELIFTNLLKERQMFVQIVPLKPPEVTPELQYKEWLRHIYEECFNKILNCCESSPTKIQIQGLTTAMNLINYEAKYPLEAKLNLRNYIPLNKLKAVLMKLLTSKENTSHLIQKYEEYLVYDDVLFFTWKILPSLTAKANPNEFYMLNYLQLMEKMQVKRNDDPKAMCWIDGDEKLTFHFDQVKTKRYLNKIWNCLMLWQHTPATHKQLLIVLLERVLPHLEKPLLMTDFLMDSLDVGGPVSLLALQGMFTMIQVHNLEYPNIFAKLYSMFEPEIFHTKFKARLFYLSDLFLSSSHLPGAMVAAFAKRLARLALIAPSEDIIIICMFIGNLIIRHPNLKSLLNRPNGGSATSDPYIMDERDPLKSNAMNSSLWEIQTLQHHVLPSVATAARFINSPLPKVEWDFSKILDSTGDDIFDKEIKKNSKLIVLAFDRPNGSCLTRGEKIALHWNI